MAFLPCSFHFACEPKRGRPTPSPLPPRRPDAKENAPRRCTDAGKLLPLQKISCAREIVSKPTFRSLALSLQAEGETLSTLHTATSQRTTAHETSTTSASSQSRAGRPGPRPTYPAPRRCGRAAGPPAPAARLINCFDFIKNSFLCLQTTNNS